MSAAGLACARRAEAGAEPPAPAPASVAASPGATPASFRFVEVGQQAGLSRHLHAGRPGKDHLLDSAGGGAAWLDYDRDGWIDAYVVGGWKLDGASILEKGRNALYRNRGDGTFEDVTDRAGVGGEGLWGGGVAAADFDGDGWTDLLLTNFGPITLYRNTGDGAFRNVAREAGLESPGWNTGAAFLDAEGDGDLDLYVSAYIDCSMEEVLKGTRTLDWKGVDKVAPGPFGLKGAADHFFLSDGKGRFSDATAAAGLIDLSLSFGFGVRAADYDADGDPDLFVANDSDANYLYRNEGKGRFRDVGLWSGAAFSGTGAAQAGMGVAAGDEDLDGDLDIFVTNFSEDFSTLYRNDGKGFFEDVSDRTGVGPATYVYLSWGTAMADLDNDGDLDIAVANGHIYPQVDAHPEFGLTYAQPIQILENRNGLFVEATASAGPGLQTKRPHRGLAAGDYDNDGDLDLLVTALDSPPLLLRNESVAGSWLIVALEAPAGAGPLIGTRITATVGGRSLLRDVAAGDSYLSTHDPRVHFGLGGAKKVDRLDIRWPDGTTRTLQDVEAGRILKLVRPKP